LWDQLIEIAAQAGEARKALEFLRKTEGRKDLTESARRLVSGQLCSALLAADEIEEGVKMLREQVNGTSKLDAGYAGLHLTQIGQLMEKPEWIETGVTALQASVAQLGANPNENYWFTRLSEELAKLLEAQGRLDAAEEIRVQKLLVASRPPPPNGYTDERGLRSALAELASFYRRNERPLDVLELISSADGWGVEDIATLLANNESGNESIAFDAAESLHALGRSDEAKRIIEAYLQAESGKDQALHSEPPRLALRGERHDGTCRAALPARL
jgi:hypothetical protein